MKLLRIVKEETKIPATKTSESLEPKISCEKIKE
jgi:hypothetical protein